MKAIELVIKLQSPLLIARTHFGDENSRVSLDYIPGNTIKGAVIQQYLMQNSIGEEEMQDADSNVRKLFFSDAVRFLNAYPYDEAFTDHPRSLPVPFSWFVEKKDKENQNNNRAVWDFAVQPADLEQAKNEPRNYFWQQAEGDKESGFRFALVSPGMTSSVHNMSVQPHIKSQQNSTVFRYEVLKASQAFCTYIIADDDSLLALVDKFIPTGSVYLGGSRGARYGHTEFVKNIITNWSEYSMSNSESNKLVTFTLISDVILRNGSGEPTFDFRQALTEKMGPKQSVTPVRSFVKTGTVGTFNRKWGLPTLQDQVILKGSCFVFEFDPQLEPESEQIESLVKMGIGERLSDGFGRVALNLSSIESFVSYTPEIRQNKVLSLSEDSKPLLKRMATKHLESCVDDAILAYLQTIQFNKDRQPENSQLNKLRILSKQAIRDPKNGSLTFENFFKGLRKENAYLQFDRTHIWVNGKQITWLSWIQ